MEEEPATHQHRDYVGDFAEVPVERVEAPIIEEVEHSREAEPVASLFNEAADEEHKDLDVPAFMRRHKF
jgi:hypothetical protein